MTRSEMLAWIRSSYAAHAEGWSPDEVALGQSLVDGAIAWGGSSASISEILAVIAAAFGEAVALGALPGDALAWVEAWGQIPDFTEHAAGALDVPAAVVAGGLGALADLLTDLGAAATGAASVAGSAAQGASDLAALSPRTTAGVVALVLGLAAWLRWGR